MRGIDTLAAQCLGELGVVCGFELTGIATRELDRDRRLMPARNHWPNNNIEARMYEEYVVVLVKPTL